MSLLVHAILLAIGLVWVFQVIHPPEKKVDFMPNSGGGGAPVQVQQRKQQIKMIQTNMARVAAVNAVSNFVLPEPEEISQMSSMSSLSAGGLSGGLGGSGKGGGRGTGDGPGFGSGAFAGNHNGKGTSNPFGMISGEQNALVGSFYDLKQTSNRKETEMSDSQFREEMKDVVKRGFRENDLRKYFKAPRELYQTKFYIPVMPAEGAPAAFECEKEVQPRRWVVTYRGAVQAPKTGKFRFVGAGDDMLVVRFNNRPVFDFGYTLAFTSMQVTGRSDELAGVKANPEVAKDLRRLSPMVHPITFYKYASTPIHNKELGGFAVGPVFEVEGGKNYPIEVLIGEIPGGLFSLALLIEEVGVNYQKDPAGSPILPLFRLDNSLPNPKLKGQAPPFDPNGPVWRSVPGGPRKDI